MGCNSYVVFMALSINNNTFNLELVCFSCKLLLFLFFRLGLLNCLSRFSKD